MLAGFAILGGAALFYSNQSRYIQGSAVVLVAASAAWVVLLLIATRVLSGTAYISGVLATFLLLAPFLSTIGATWNLLSKRPNSQNPE
jgi:hypothetical protein